LTLNSIHPLTETAVDIHAMLSGGAMGRERYRLSDIRLTQREADFVFTMARVCEEIMQERSRAQNVDAAANRPEE
jgi:hypothetical protein